MGLDEKVDNSLFEKPFFKRALERSPYFIREDEDFVKLLKDNIKELIIVYYFHPLFPFPSGEYAHYKVFIGWLPPSLASSLSDETAKKLSSYAQKAFFFLEILHEEGKIGTWDKKGLESFIQSKSKKNEQELQEIIYYGTAQVLSHNIFKYTNLLGAKYVFLALGDLREEFEGVVNEIQKGDIDEGLKDKIKGLIETHQFLDIYIDTAKEIINGGEGYSLGKHYKLFEDKLFDILGEQETKGEEVKKQDEKLEEQKRKEIYLLFDIADGLSRRWPFYRNKIKVRNVEDDDIP